MPAEAMLYWADRAWVQGGWASGVLLSVGADGHWSGVESGVSQPADARKLPGPVLPGLVNAHSHAFQRAIAGLTERAVDTQDDFWSWRERMYSAALRIGPQQLEAIAALLYAELLRGGYTQVCEFHYLHNATDGRPYANPMEMSLALLRAARQVGMGITLLPTLYMRAGFAQPALRDEQRRFASSVESVLSLAHGVVAGAGGGTPVNAGVALHSLRAVTEDAVTRMDAATREHGMPLHIHVAEQGQEVDDCIAQYGLRPIEWLLQHAQLDSRWNLVHATQATAAELQAVQACGASVVLCPSTEANLGDGSFNLPAYAAAGGCWSIGSDSHVTRGWAEELRLLEYSQRLQLRQRNIAGRSAGAGSSAAALFNTALAGGPAATGLPLAGIAVGQRADFLVLEPAAPALLGVPVDYLLDALVFSSPDTRFSDVFVAGRQVLEQGRLCGADGHQHLWPQLAADFSNAMRGLWADA